MKVKWYGKATNIKKQNGAQWVDELFGFSFGNADMRWVNFYSRVEKYACNWWLPPNKRSKILGDRDEI